FTPQLNLSEVVFANTVANTEPMLNATEGSRVNIDDAHQRTQGLLNQFATARSAGAADMDLLTTYLLPALEGLAEVGAQKELRDLTSSFEGLLGSLRLINVPEMATSLARLASLYRAQGRYGEAEPLYVRSLHIREQQLGSDHPDTATSLNNLALLYESQGRYSEAEPLFLQALEIRRSQLGQDHPDTATSLGSLAAL
ncbi:MAG: tetratricopeptide repeat protein, partial [Cyanobacteria bacterium CAN_BIN43]|nr:tetratricopeptide repeat protein [Cyanobacteria bacterium CAN_BIN43]